MGLKYTKDIIKELKNVGYTTYRLRTEKIFGGTIMNKFAKKEPVSWEIIERICKLLRCQPCYFLEYDFNEDEEENK